MNTELTELLVLADESSSMGVVRDQSIGAINELIASQKLKPGKCRFTYTKFASTVSEPVIFSTPLEDVRPLTREDYCPNGMTALYDGIGYNIDRLGQRLAGTPENERPAQVIFVIQTDGHENFSMGYNLAGIQKMIDHQKTKYNWDFIFMGADINAMEAGTTLHINPKSTLDYGKYSTKNAVGVLDTYLTTARTLGIASAGFSAADRLQATVVDGQ